MCVRVYVCAYARVCTDEQGSDLPQTIVVKCNGTSSGRHSETLVTQCSLSYSAVSALAHFNRTHNDMFEKIAASS